MAFLGEGHTLLIGQLLGEFLIVPGLKTPQMGSDVLKCSPVHYHDLQSIVCLAKLLWFLVVLSWERAVDCASLQGALSLWRSLTSLLTPNELGKTNTKLRSAADQHVIIPCRIHLFEYIVMYT